MQIRKVLSPVEQDDCRIVVVDGGNGRVMRSQGGNNRDVSKKRTRGLRSFFATQYIAAMMKFYRQSYARRNEFQGPTVMVQ